MNLKCTLNVFLFKMYKSEFFSNESVLFFAFKNLIDVQRLKINLNIYRLNRIDKINLPATTIAPISGTTKAIATTVIKTPPIEDKGLLYYMLYTLTELM